MDPLAKLRSMRDGLGGVIELLVALVDDLDGDELLEDDTEDRAVDDDRIDAADSGDDEPSLGGPSWGEVDLELDDSDREPSLGRLETIDQSRQLGDSADREYDVQDQPHDSDEGHV